MPTDARIDQEWKGLTELDEQGRVEQMTERFRALLAMSDEERQARLEEMVRAEGELADEALREFTYTRLLSWIALVEEDREGTRSLAHGYHRVSETLPAQVAMRQASIMQTMGSSRLTLTEIDMLLDVVPGLERQVSRQPHSIVSKAAPETAPVEKPKPFWARFLSFGRKPGEANET